MYIKLAEKEILDYAIAEEGLLFASADDYLAIADIVIEQINAKLKCVQPRTVNDALIDAGIDPDKADFKDLLELLEPQPTSQDVLDAERWNYYIETCSGEAAFELTGITDASNEQINTAIDAKMKESK